MRTLVLLIVALLWVSSLSSPTLGRLVQNMTLNKVHFLPDLVGSRKGDSGEGIHYLRQYLQRFGYLTTTMVSITTDFDDELESAVRTYQQNFHLNVTGEFDAATAVQMAVPRCGVPDVIDGVNLMQDGAGPMWAHFSWHPKWGPDKRHLRWAFAEGGGADFVLGSALHESLDQWASVGIFTFEMIADPEKADIKVGFFRGAHGDDRPFDGPNGILGHGYPPPSGLVHFDQDEKWSFKPEPDALDVESVAVHEFGHMLGLAHSREKGAVMWPYIPAGSTRRALHPDDIEGLRALYQ